MQTDPIGYEDGMNWYAYVGNDPVNMVDPLGLKAYGDSGRCTTSGPKCSALLSDEGKGAGNSSAAINFLSSIADSFQSNADNAQQSMTSASNAVTNKIPQGIRNEPLGTVLDVGAIAGGYIAIHTGVFTAAGYVAISYGTDGLYQKLSARDSIIKNSIEYSLDLTGLTYSKRDVEAIYLGVGLGAGGYKGWLDVYRGSGNFLEVMGAVSDAKTTIDFVSKP